MSVVTTGVYRVINDGIMYFFKWMQVGRGRDAAFLNGKESSVHDAT